MTGDATLTAKAISLKFELEWLAISYVGKCQHPYWLGVPTYMFKCIRMTCVERAEVISEVKQTVSSKSMDIQSQAQWAYTVTDIHGDIPCLSTYHSNGLNK